jgi:hypothetical protein
MNGCDCRQMLAEFDEYVREADGYVKRADCLKERARSTTQLVSLPYLLWILVTIIEKMQNLFRDSSILFSIR